MRPPPRRHRVVSAVGIGGIFAWPNDATETAEIAHRLLDRREPVDDPRDHVGQIVMLTARVIDRLLAARADLAAKIRRLINGERIGQHGD